MGSSSDTTEVENLYYEGKKWFSAQSGKLDMFTEQAKPQVVLGLSVSRDVYPLFK